MGVGVNGRAAVALYHTELSGGGLLNASLQHVVEGVSVCDVAHCLLFHGACGVVADWKVQRRVGGRGLHNQGEVG